MAILSSLLVAAPPAAAQSPAPTFEATECPFELPFLNVMSAESLGFECGYVTVPEQHDDPAGPTIRLPVAILRAAAPDSQPDPVFLAQGGPGGDAFGIFSVLAPDSSITQDRDVVIFNQRGTLYAEPSLMCDESFDAMDELLALPPAESMERSLTLYQQCRQRLLDEGVNLSAYNSVQNAADVDAIRQALGYEQINFYGVSYGTLLGLHLLRDFPDSLRSVILDSVVPTQLNFIAEAPFSQERVFNEMFEACAASTQCQAEYPNLEARFTALVEQLNQQPVTIPITDPDTGESVEMYVDGGVFIEMLFQIFYLPEMYAVFPKLVVDMEAGEYGFWQLWLPQIVFDRTISEGMYFSVVCAEETEESLTGQPLEELWPLIAEASAEDLADIVALCRDWQVAQLPPLVNQPVRSDIPTLLLAGQFDPITPPAFAARAAESLANGYLFVDPTASHGVAFGDSCINNLVQDFLDDPQVMPAGSCLENRTMSQVAPANALTVPWLGRVLIELDSNTLAQTALAGLFLLALLTGFVIWPLLLLIRLLRKQPATMTPGQRWLSRFSKLLVLLFGGLAVIFVSTFTALALSMLDSPVLLTLSALPGGALPLFLIPPLLALLAVAIVLAALLLWVKGVWSVWGRLYYTLLALCAIGYVIILTTTGMMTVLI